MGRTLAEQVVDEIGLARLYPTVEAKPEKQGTETPREKGIRKLREKVEVDAVSNSTMLKVSYKHEHPDVAADVVNLLVNRYLARHLEIRTNSQRDVFFRNQFEDLEKRLKQSESDLREFKVEHGLSSSIDEEREKILLQSTKLEQTRSQNEVLIAEAGRRLSELRKQLKTGRSATGTDKAGRLFSPKVFEDVQQSAVEAEVELRAGVARRNVIDGQLSVYTDKLMELNNIQLEFDQLSQQVSVGRDNYNLYVTKFEESKISAAMDKEGIASVKVLEAAAVPTKPEDGIMRIALVASVLLGLVGGVGLVMFLEMSMATVSTPSDVERFLGVPVVANFMEQAGTA